MTFYDGPVIEPEQFEVKTFVCYDKNVLQDLISIFTVETFQFDPNFNYPCFEFRTWPGLNILYIKKQDIRIYVPYCRQTAGPNSLKLFKETHGYPGGNIG